MPSLSNPSVPVHAPTLWIAVTLAAMPASFWLWFIGGTGMCGEEVYDTRPGSVGDTLCTALVEPVVPWASLAAVPVAIAAVGGFIGLRLGRRRFFYFALAAPFVLAFGGTLALLAVF
jgi:hypothetical protein